MKALLLIVSFLISTVSLADNSYRIEKWESGEELNFVVRNELGQFQGHGSLQLESWNDSDETSEWIARRADGTFLAGSYKGKIEKFKVKGFKREQMRLVIRNTKGHFVTWVAMDELLTSQFERMDFDRDGKKETIYTIRYNGKFVNWAPARLEEWANQVHPVLVVRDTADGINNGKILTYVVGAIVNGRLQFRDPETGKFLSPNK